MDSKELAKVLAVFMLTMSTRAWAQSTADCTSTILGLAPCLSYVSGSSQTPSASCCSQLATVVQSNPVCLCLVLGGGASQFGVTINQTLALNLPVACDVRTPPVSRCKGVTDVTSPAQAPGGVTNVSRGRLLQPVATHVAFSLALVVVVYLFEPFVIF